ncbi:MAG: hypothetical protein QOG10_1912 [Kribbellaceae bacterium]|jgi:hypothetical protein|nr:hypothetical protein [Kribbellaceae bacterium]
MAKEVTPEQMHEWYRERDLLASIEPQIIKESSSLDERVARILTELNWRPDRADIRANS